MISINEDELVEAIKKLIFDYSMVCGLKSGAEQYKASFAGHFTNKFINYDHIKRGGSITLDGKEWSDSEKEQFIKGVDASCLSLIEEAKKDKYIYSALKYFLSTELEKDKLFFPKVAKEWLSKVIRNELNIPNKGPAKAMARNNLFCLILHTLDKAYMITPTCNDATITGLPRAKLSGSEYMAKAWRHGSISHTTVKDIWNESGINYERTSIPNIQLVDSWVKQLQANGNIISINN